MALIAGAVGAAVLKAVAAEPAVVREILATSGRLTTPADVAGLAARDPDVAEILRRAGGHVGRAVAAAAMVVDPQRIVISGEGVRLGDHYINAIRVELKGTEQKEVTADVVIEPWGDEAWARGAATLVLRELFHPAHLRDEATPAAAAPERVGAATEPSARSGRGDRR